MRGVELPFLSFLWLLSVLGVVGSGPEASDAGGGGAKLSLPRALLPVVRPPPSLLLTVSVPSPPACYRWTTSRDDIINIVEIDATPGCSTSARISSVPYLTHRQTAIIFAEDVYTKQILRCDIIVDKISSLEIVTTSRELFVEEAPEAFEVRAYDDQGNEFTTLDGVEFSWKITSTLKSNAAIRIITFSESSYEATAALKEMELRGLRGHTILLEGVSTGSAKVIVKLPHPEYASINSAEVTLRVVANLLIIPADVSIQQFDIVKFKIIQVREGRLIEIPQPSPQYWLEINDSTIATLDDKTGLATGRSLGSTQLFLRDAAEDNGESDAVRLPEANLHVVTPYALQLGLRPIPTSRLWSVQCGSNVTIIVQVLDNNGRRVQVGSETRINLTVNESLLEVKWRNINGTILNGFALNSGVVAIKATLLSVAGKPVKPDITVDGEIHIFDKIEVIPSVSLIPWDSVNYKGSNVQLKAIGGNGMYIWRGDGPLTVDSQGLVSATEIGNGTVMASMPSNPNIFGKARVLIADPLKMEIVHFEEEGPVGSKLSIHVALFTRLFPKAEKFTSFTDCHHVPFKMVSVEGVNFELISHPLQEEIEYIDTACTVLYAHCLEVGTGLIKIFWGSLEATLSLRCYAQLQTIYPSSSVVLTVGSSLNVIFSGGPVSWYDEDYDKQEEINILNDNIAKISKYEYSLSRALHVYTVTCLELGKTEANLKMYSNYDAMINTASKAAETSITVYCSNPHTMKLLIKKNVGDLCPTTSLSQMLVLSEGEPVEVEVLIFDENGYQFHNATSLRARWNTKPFTILQDVPSERFLTKLDQQYDIPVIDYHYQIVRLTGHELLNKGGVAEINLEVIGFRSTVLKIAHVRQAPVISAPLKVTLPVKFILPVQIENEKITIFNHLNNVVHISLLNGSGNFQLSKTTNNYASITLDSPRRMLKIQPYSDGDMTVTITDLCVASSSITLQIHIVSIANIIGTIPELIEKGQNVKCIVNFYDKIGNILPANIDGAPALIARVTEGHVNISPDAERNNKIGIEYTVTGLELGDANIEFTAGNVRGLVHTYVFPPLQLVPKMSLILPGGTIKLGVMGGPPPPAIIKFNKTTGASDIIDINNSGIIKGIGVGMAEIKGYAEGFKGSESVQAFASVRVLPLEGITIHAPSSTLLAGNSMPLWAMGIPDSLSPVELGSLKPPLHFRWSISGDGVVSISDILSLTGVEFDDVDRVAVRLKAVHPGSVTVHLNVTATPGSIIAKMCGFSWYAKFDMSVIEPLRIKKPQVNTSHLLLAPHSTVQIEVNNPLEKTVFRLIEDTEKSSDESLAKISPDGKLITYGRLGFGMIIISNSEPNSWSNQHISFTFEICTPHYSMLEVEDKHAWNKLGGLGALPTGLTLPLILSKFDNFGRKFALSSFDVSYFTNRPDLIFSLSNSSVVKLLLAEPGQSVLKLWDTSSEKQFSDYLAMKSILTIYPQKILATVGDVWCMRSAILNGMWSENSGGAVHINNAGMTQARTSHVAATSLMFQPSFNLPYLTQATVVTRPADLIYFLDADIKHVVTNEEPHTVNLVLSNHEEQNKISNLLFSENSCIPDHVEYFPFTCEVKQSKKLTVPDIVVKPIFNKLSSTYGCQVTWIPDTPMPIFTTNDSNSVRLFAHIGGISTEPIILKRINAAVIQQTNVVLSPPPANLASIDITASSDVLKQIKVVSESEILLVENPIHLSDTKIRFIIRATNKLNQIGNQKLFVKVVSPLTYQNVEIPVSVSNGNGISGSCVMGGDSIISRLVYQYQPILLFVITIVTIVAATTYVYTNIIHPMRFRTDIMPNTTLNNTAQNIRSMSYQSRSPFQLNTSNSSFSPHDMSSSFTHSPPNQALDDSDIAVYGDPSYIPPYERRRNRRFL